MSVQRRIILMTEEATIAAAPASSAFYCQSSERMDQLDDKSVALTVTSPPYWNAIDYDLHAGDKDNSWYRTRRYSDGFEGYAGYLDLMERIFAETYRVTKPGGFCAVVVGTVLLKGTHIPVPYDLTGRLTSSGWEFHQDIIWHKTTAGVRRAGVAIRHPFPGYYYPNIMTEYILLFRRPGPPIYRQADGKRDDSRFEIGDLYTHEIANNVWHIAPVPPNLLSHPCPFPEEIPYRLIEMYSYKHDLILDPFCGSGQTGKVATALGRRTVNYDTRQEYTDYAKKRLAEPLHLRKGQLFAKFGKLPLTAAESRLI